MSKGKKKKAAVGKELRAEALEVLNLLRDYIDFEGDDDVNEGMRWTFIEAAGKLAEEIAGITEEGLIKQREDLPLEEWVCDNCDMQVETLTGRPHICPDCGER